MCKKRGQNQSSVYRRSSDGRWVAQLTIQKKHSMKYFYSQPEADVWLNQAKVAQERLGHARIGYTLGTYSHVLPSIQAEAAEKMDELVLQTSKGGNLSKLEIVNFG